MVVVLIIEATETQQHPIAQASAETKRSQPHRPSERN